MTRFICATCGTQYADTDQPPTHCAICEDERQYVGWGGQQWTTHDTLAKKHSIRMEDEAGLLAIGVTPAFAIDQRSFFLSTDAGNILWECQSKLSRQSRNVVGSIASSSLTHTSMAQWLNGARRSVAFRS